MGGEAVATVAIAPPEISRQDLIDHLASVLGRQRRITWNGRDISLPQALVKASSLSDRDLIRLGVDEVQVESLQPS